MAYLKRMGVSPRACALRPYLLPLGVLLSSLLSASIAAVHAAPITLQFDTTVASTVGLPLGPTELNSPLPFAVAEGDPFTASFTYEPAIGSGTYVQSGELQFMIGGQHLLVTPFRISVVNNGIGFIDASGRIADPARTPIVDRALFLADQLAISCPSGGSASYCGTISGHDDFKFNVQMLFEEDLNLQTLTSTSLPADQNLWNTFRNREMRIGFNNGAFIGAYIGALRQIPEPSSGLMMFVLMIILFIDRSTFGIIRGNTA